jgi:D-alanine-D-alanine ligase and related ATP-grasp enzymes
MIAVLMGGYSAEREISLLSGMAVYDALSNSKLDCFAYDLTKDNLDQLWSREFDQAFIVLHGRAARMDLFNLSLKKQYFIYWIWRQSFKLCMDKAATKIYGAS